MHNITFISTTHQEIGKCNADELCAILEKMNPEVIFLEALETTYSEYEQLQFRSFGVYHRKLEIRAIQQYANHFPLEYVPVLDTVFSDSFYNKYSSIGQRIPLQKMLDNYHSLVRKQGFEFLNSTESMKLQEEMRELENHFLDDKPLEKAVNETVDAYENSMMRNIYSYCNNHQFDRAIFLCGAAHRCSIIEKIQIYKRNEKLALTWRVYGN
ncbi:MAG: hypothetical protein AAF985_24145 [Bacteroidota bacterium]